MDLYCTFECGDDYYTTQLYRLIAKADGHNKALLAVVYPLEVSLYVEWHATTPEWKFFEKYNVGDSLDEHGKKVYDWQLERNKGRDADSNT